MTIYKITVFNDEKLYQKIINAPNESGTILQVEFDNKLFESYFETPIRELAQQFVDKFSEELRVKESVPFIGIIKSNDQFVVLEGQEGLLH